MAKVLSVLRGKRRTRPFQRSVFLLPSMFTVGNLFCGYACIVYAMRGDVTAAAVFIGAAIILDGLDGRVARLTDAASEFGGEFDSLADVISFGVAPAILVFSWGLEDLGRVGWAAGFLYVTAAALRLARFNVQADGGDKRYFAGMPSPAAAGVVASTVFAWPEGLPVAPASMIALAVVILPALLMVSRLRFRSFGALSLRPRRSSLVLLQFAFLVAAIAVRPAPVLFTLSVIYLLSGPVVALASRLRGRGRRGGDAHDTPHTEANERVG